MRFIDVSYALCFWRHTRVGDDYTTDPEYELPVMIYYNALIVIFCLCIQYISYWVESAQYIA